MKSILIPCALLTLVVGCVKSEAERFGYKGADLADDDQMFFTTGPAVTNWVPARVLSVCEEYPMSAEETALIAAAGVVTPSESFADAPEGYSKSVEEPWFVTWTKDAENFGRKGVNGFIAHYDEDRKTWLTGETYFSSYYDSEAAALAALADLKARVGDKAFAPKRFYDFERCWVAEYLRLRVMCLVGQKPDGSWSCMLDIQDKCNSGCGVWEPVSEQEQRLAEYQYRKAFAAWKAERARILAENHAAVEKLRQEKGLPLFEGVKGVETDDGRLMYVRTGTFASDAGTDRQAVWRQKAKDLETATGVAVAGAPEVQDIPSGYSIWGGAGVGELYEVRLDVAFPSAEPKEDGQAEGDGPAPEPPQGEWRELCFEKLQPGFVVPQRPQPPRF